MAESIHAQIFDRLVTRQLQVLRVETGLRQEVFAQLALLESEMLSALKSQDPTDFALLTRRRRAVERLMIEEIDPLIVERYQHIADLLDAALLRLARNEAGAVQTIVNEVTGEPLVEDAPTPTHLRAGVVHGLFPSPAKPTDLATTGQEWWSRAGRSLAQRVGDSLTVGVALEDTLTALSQRIKGSPENAFADGIFARARQDAEHLLRTQVTNATGEARVAVADTNAGPIRALEHVSILDSRVSLVCLSRNGLRYTVPGHEPLNHSVPYLTGIPYHPS